MFETQIHSIECVREERKKKSDQFKTAKLLKIIQVGIDTEKNNLWSFI